MAFFKPRQMKINGKFYPTAVLVDRPMEIEKSRHKWPKQAPWPRPM